MQTDSKSKIDTIRQKIYIVIYGTNTPAGRIFDMVLLVLILLSVLAVMLETVVDIDIKYHKELILIEWIFTSLFTIEYILRIFSTKKPWKYIFSFYGIIDLVAVLPMYLSFFFPGSSVIASVRALRLLRIFRILNITQYIGESNKLKSALRDSKPKIIIFLFSVVIICVLMGTVMYLVEGEESGFDSIPHSIYWCIVTLTTVGFGDITPVTGLGRFIASLIMITGYGIIAVPTGIVSAEFTKQKIKGKKKVKAISMCPVCNERGHKVEADYCYNCGEKLNNKTKN
ncbi:MAG: ion transporter [Flavobacteriales bacterium]|nr:ion transporter [Flavobacteriales bacterium]